MICRSLPGLAVSTALTVLAAGCGDSRPPVDTTTAKSQIHGTVQVDGKLVNAGDVIYNPSNAVRKVASVVGKIGPDGTYSLSSLQGLNEVRFAGPFTANRPEFIKLSRFVLVEPGDNEVHFDLFGPGDTPKGDMHPVKSPVKSPK